MIWSFKNNQPIYTQIIEFIKLRIISGYYPIGGRLPSVRDLASEASVNPNTMQKALSELEDIGLIYSQRTSGRFITENSNVITDIRNQIASNYIKEFLETMGNMGLKRKDIFELLTKNEEDNL
jgi:Predicted transcriptional regulators